MKVEVQKLQRATWRTGISACREGQGHEVRESSVWLSVLMVRCVCVAIVEPHAYPVPEARGAPAHSIRHTTSDPSPIASGNVA